MVRRRRPLAVRPGRRSRTSRRREQGAHMVALVCTGARFENGQLIERAETLAA